MKRIIFCGLLFALCFIQAQEVPLDPAVKTGVLENGLTYYVMENDKPADKVEMRLAINAGSVLEDDDQRGLAHFMEHMNFNGTKNFPDNELVDFLQSIGIKFGQHLNAYTSFDETVYMLPVPLDKPDNLDKGLLVLEDWAFNASLTAEQIDKERGVVLEELRTGLGANKRMLDEYLPTVLHGSKYAERLPIGTEASLKNFDHEALRRFHKDWYRPDLMAVIIVGDIDADEMVAKIKKNFGKYPKAKNPRERETFFLKNHEDTKIEIVTDPEASFSDVNFYFKSKDNFEQKNTMEHFFKNMIEGMTATMLNNRIQELVNSKNPPFTYGYVFSGSTWARTKEAVQGVAMVGEGKQAEALRVLLEETNRAIEYGFTPSEFERAKKQIMSQLEEQYNNRDKRESGRLVSQFINNFLEKTPAPSIEWRMEQYQKMMPIFPLEAVNKYVATWKTEGNKVIVVKGPEKEGVEMPKSENIAALLEEVNKAKLEPYKDADQIDGLLTKTLPKGSVVKTEKDKDLGTVTWTLSNGAKVTYKVTNFKDDEILFRGYSVGGTSMLPADEFKKTTYAFSALQNAGVNGLELNQIDQFMQDKNADLSYNLSSYSESLRGSSTKEDLTYMMQMLYSKFTSLNFDTEAYDAEFQKMNAFYKNLTSQPQFYFAVEHNKFMNKGNDRYTYPFPTEETWKQTDFEQAFNFQTERTADADDYHFYFVGNIDEAELKSLVETYIASLPSKPEVTDQMIDSGFREPKGPMTKKYYKGTDPKAQVSIEISGETEYDRSEVMAMDAMEGVLKIKLTEVLREEESGVYGTRSNAYISKIPYEKFQISISFTCAPENADKLTALALGELRKIATEGPQQKDLDKYIEGELNDYKDNMERNSYWIGHLVAMQSVDKPKEAILTRAEDLKALTVKDVQKVAKKYATQPEVVAMLLPEASE